MLLISLFFSAFLWATEPVVLEFTLLYLQTSLISLHLRFVVAASGLHDTHRLPESVRGAPSVQGSAETFLWVPFHLPHLVWNIVV